MEALEFIHAIKYISPNASALDLFTFGKTFFLTFSWNSYKKYLILKFNNNYYII